MYFPRREWFVLESASILLCLEGLVQKGKCEKKP